jgi:RND family efflux transporter MFP subunit
MMKIPSSLRTLGLAWSLALLTMCPAWAGTAVPTVLVKTAGNASGFELDGVVQARQQAAVAAQVSGNVLALLVKAGDTVKAGQLLLRIDDRDAAAGLARAEAGVAQANAEWRNAKVAVERNTDLRAKGFVSQAALDVAQTQLSGAQAGLQQAQSARSQAVLARGFAAVTAPFAGVVLNTQVDAGDLATPGRPLLTLYAPGALRAVVQVPSSRAAQALAASAVQVQLPDGRWTTPSQRQVLPLTDPVSQTVEWRLDLAAPQMTGLSPGQSLRVRFDAASSSASANANASVPATATDQVINVPASAVLRRGELEAVYVVQGPHFVLRAVRLGQVRSGGVDVLAGLRADERIALDGVRAGLADAVPAQ